MNWKHELASLGKIFLSYLLVMALAIIAATIVLGIVAGVMKWMGVE